MPSTIPSRMAAVQLVGHGGLDKLRYRCEVPVPVARAGEVLIRVAAAGVNNTDVNTRIGWYSKAIGESTGTGAAGGFEGIDDADASWSGVALEFPRIQGADCCGRIVAVGEGVDRGRIGERVMSATCCAAPSATVRSSAGPSGPNATCAFAYAARPRAKRTRSSNWSDAELASVPCDSTAENLLHRASVGAERCSSPVRGWRRVRCHSPAKRSQAPTSSPSQTPRRPIRYAQSARTRCSTEPPTSLPRRSRSVRGHHVVAGPSWPRLLDVLRRGGRYATAGAMQARWSSWTCGI